MCRGFDSLQGYHGVYAASRLTFPEREMILHCTLKGFNPLGCVYET